MAPPASPPGSTITDADTEVAQTSLFGNETPNTDTRVALPSLTSKADETGNGKTDAETEHAKDDTEVDPEQGTAESGPLSEDKRSRSPSPTQGSTTGSLPDGLAPPPARPGDDQHAFVHKDNSDAADSATDDVSWSSTIDWAGLARTAPLVLGIGMGKTLKLLRRYGGDAWTAGTQALWSFVSSYASEASKEEIAGLKEKLKASESEVAKLWTEIEGVTTTAGRKPIASQSRDRSPGGATPRRVASSDSDNGWIDAGAGSGKSESASGSHDQKFKDPETQEEGKQGDRSSAP